MCSGVVRGVAVAALLLPLARVCRGCFSAGRVVLWQSSPAFLDALRWALGVDGFDAERVMLVNVYRFRSRGRVYTRRRIVLLEPVARLVHRLLFPRAKPILYRTPVAREALRRAVRSIRSRRAPRLYAYKRLRLRVYGCDAPGCIARRLWRRRSAWHAAYWSCTRARRDLYLFDPMGLREACARYAYEMVGGEPPPWLRGGGA